jgi:hypothetical protein
MTSVSDVSLRETLRDTPTTPVRITAALERRRRYYQANRDKIREQDKKGRRWERYYERHKEEVRQKNLARYHQKKREQQEQLVSAAPTASAALESDSPA